MKRNEIMSMDNLDLTQRVEDPLPLSPTAVKRGNGISKLALRFLHFGLLNFMAVGLYN